MSQKNSENTVPSWAKRQPTLCPVTRNTTAIYNSKLEKKPTGVQFTPCQKKSWKHIRKKTSAFLVSGHTSCSGDFGRNLHNSDADRHSTVCPDTARYGICLPDGTWQGIFLLDAQCQGIFLLDAAVSGHFFYGRSCVKAFSFLTQPC